MGAVFLGLVAVLPYIINVILTAFQISAGTSSSMLFLTTSSGLLIVVGVVRDLFMTIDAELKLHGYDEKLLVR